MSGLGRSRPLVVGLVSFVMVVTAVALFVASFMRVEREIEQLATPPASALTVSPVSFAESYRTAVAVAPVYSQSEPLLAPDWFGTVTAVYAEPGAAVNSLDIVVEIDGVDRMAYASAKPFARPLARRDSGEDVVALHGLLQHLGLLDASVPHDDTMSWSSVLAVRELAEYLGVPGRVDVFDPGWIIWLPVAPYTVAEVNLAPAQAAPALGSEVVSGQPTLTDLMIRVEEGHLPQMDGEWSLEIGDRRVRLVDGVVNGPDLSELAQTATWLAEDSDVASGFVELADPLPLLRIPASAVRSNPTGDLCVWLESSDAQGSSFRAASVVVGSTSVSSVSIESGLDAEDLVLANPSSVLASSACP